jgi:hypothetical protein
MGRTCAWAESSAGDTPANSWLRFGIRTGRDWAETMNAMVSDAEFQKAVAEADRLCELQSRSIVIDLDLA